MKKIIFAALIAAAFLMPQIAMARSEENKAFRQEQKEERRHFWSSNKQENRQFHENLKGLSPEEKQKAVLEHRTAQIQKKNEFHEKMRQENNAFAKSRLDRNPNLTEAQKSELSKYIDEQQKKVSDFRAQQQTENQAFLEKTFNDASLTQPQKKEAIRKFFSDQKSENREFRKGARGEWKTYKESVKQQTAAAVPASAN